MDDSGRELEGHLQAHDPSVLAGQAGRGVEHGGVLAGGPSMNSRGRIHSPPRKTKTRLEQGLSVMDSAMHRAQPYTDEHREVQPCTDALEEVSLQ